MNKTLVIKYILSIIQRNPILTDSIFKDSISRTNGSGHILRFQVDIKFERQILTQSLVHVEKKKTVRD